MFEGEISRAYLRPMAQIITAMLIIPGRVTMEGLSRWTGPSGSCRQIKCEKMFKKIERKNANKTQIFWLVFIDSTMSNR